VTETRPYYPSPWPRTDRAITDVAVLGAGQSGLAILHGLKLAGIDNVALYDAAQPDSVGVWQSVARMRTLRTDKTINGPELGNAALSFRAWLTLKEGAAAFDAIDRIPRLQWQAYLDWFSTQIGAAPHWDHRLKAVVPADEGLLLHFETSEGSVTRPARHLVIATGVDGFGAAYVPQILQDRVAPDRLWHTQDAIPDHVFGGRRLLVVGSSASAFDVASAAMERGAVELHQIGRNPDLARHANPDIDLRAMVASQRVFRHLSDTAKWAAVLQQRARGNAPPQSVARAQAHSGYHLHLGASPDALTATASGGALTIDGQTLAFDHVICGTGYRQGAHLRPEFAGLASLLRHWRDLNLPAPAGLAHWNDLPFVGDGFELLPRLPTDSWVSRLHVFTFAAILNHGMHVGDIGTAMLAVPRLVDHLSTKLFKAARTQHEAAALKGQVFPRSPSSSSPDSATDSAKIANPEGAAA
jgi:cation diffusion facilitator CzcD-associated flavoprotein CzcO